MGEIKIEVDILYSPHAENKLDRFLIEQAIVRFTGLSNVYDRITVLVADQHAINSGFFERNEKRLFGKTTMALSGKTTAILSASLPPKGCIEINSDKFCSFPEWKQKFAIRHECCHLLEVSPSSTTLQRLVQAYGFEYMRDIIRYRREFVAHICMLKRYPSDWLREPLRIPENIMSPRVFYGKIKRNKGPRAAVEVAISNCIKVLSLVYIYEYLIENVKCSSQLRRDLGRYKSYLQSWWNQVRRDTSNKLPLISDFIQKQDFEDKETFFQKVENLLGLLDSLFPRISGSMERWNPTLADVAKSVRLIEQYFGKEWLRKQIKVQNRRPRGWRKKFTHHLKPEPHPILPLYLNTLANLESLKRNSGLPMEKSVLELLSFCDTLRVIKNIDVVDVRDHTVATKPWSKFKARLKDRDEFNQASYEMQIAAALRRSGFKVYFIQESVRKGEKTPDLLVKKGKEEIYVECKYRRPTKRELQYKNMFNEFYSRSMRLMYKLGKFYSIVVEWLHDPTISLVESEIEFLESKIRNGEEGYFKTQNAKLWLKHLASEGEVFEGSYNVNIGEYRSEQVDIMIAQAYSCPLPANGLVKYKNPTFVMFRNISYLDDMIDGIVELLNKAYHQILENGPGIVFLEAHLSFLDQNIKESLQDLENRLKRKLNLISRVNAIIITRSYFSEERVKVANKEAVVIARKVESRTIPNTRPASSISRDSFKKILSLRYY